MHDVVGHAEQAVHVVVILVYGIRPVGVLHHLQVADIGIVLVVRLGELLGGIAVAAGPDVVAYVREPSRRSSLGTC
jgi:hypothetical protein